MFIHEIFYPHRSRDRHRRSINSYRMLCCEIETCIRRDKREWCSYNIMHQGCQGPNLKGQTSGIIVKIEFEENVDSYVDEMEPRVKKEA